MIIPEQGIIVCEALKNQLPVIIKDCYDFVSALKLTTLQQRTIVFEALKSKLSMIIKNSYEFGRVLESLMPEQGAIVFEALKERLPVIIEDSNDLASILKRLTPEQGAIVFEAQKERFSVLITTVDDFGRVLEPLTPEQRTDFFNMLKEQLPKLIITSISEFAFVLKKLLVEQGSVVYESLKAQLPMLIKNISDFVLVLKALPPEQRIDLCEVLKQQFHMLIKDDTDFNKLLRSLTPEEGKLISIALKKPSFSIKNSHEFHIFADLPLNQCNAVSEPLQQRFYSIEEFINKYETRVNKSSQNPIKQDELSTESQPNVEEHLKRVLLQLKGFVEKEAWNNQAIHLFRRPPDGVQKIRSLLANTELNDFEKFNGLYEIVVNKCKNPSYFRKTLTSNFYQELLTIFNDVSIEPFERTLNAGERQGYIANS